MTANRFFIDTERPLTASAVLKGEEHHHLKNVARIKPGDRVWLINKAGESYSALVERIEKSQTLLTILDKIKRTEPRVKVTLAQALIKMKNFELIIQKATELAVHELIPVVATRSLIRIEDKLENKKVRWLKILRESAKQSGVVHVPAILSAKTLNEVVRGRQDEAKIFLSEHKGMPMRHFLMPEKRKKQGEQYPSSLLILVGPEGGWTESEEEDIVGHGFQAISLGRQVLRTETAAISSLAMVDHFWNQ